MKLPNVASVGFISAGCDEPAKLFLRTGRLTLCILFVLFSHVRDGFFFFFFHSPSSRDWQERESSAKSNAYRSLFIPRDDVWLNDLPVVLACVFFTYTFRCMCVFVCVRVTPTRRPRRDNSSSIHTLLSLSLTFARMLRCSDHHGPVVILVKEPTQRAQFSLSG